MIRAGRTAITDDDVASAHGFVSLRAGKRAGLFDNPTLPKPVNNRGGAKRGNKRLYDAAQIHAHAVGEPIPDLPIVDHPDDLLDLHEAAEVWGISPVTFQYYLNKQPHLIPEPIQIGGVLHWRRDDLTDFERPGRGTGGGRAAGTTDTTERRRRGEVQLHVLEVLAEGPRNGYQIAEAIAERSGGPKPTNLHTTLTKMQQAGLLVSEKVGRSRIYQLTEAGRETPPWEVLGGEARRTRVQQMLAEAGDDLSVQDVADALEVHPDHARRILNAVRAEAAKGTAKGTRAR
ncbi:PadR family transcriptional regulator [Actinomadura napierensis]|uniref:PadR family transcriptional regulator n=1 Tax=Actinomadura napierensis TaxID=267854 RepID=UPI0031D8B4FF